MDALARSSHVRPHQPGEDPRSVVRALSPWGSLCAPSTMASPMHISPPPCLPSCSPIPLHLLPDHHFSSLYLPSPNFPSLSPCLYCFLFLPSTPDCSIFSMLSLSFTTFTPFLQLLCHNANGVVHFALLAMLRGTAHAVPLVENCHHHPSLKLASSCTVHNY